MLLQREPDVTDLIVSFPAEPEISDAEQRRVEPVREQAQRYGERRGPNAAGLAAALGVQLLAIPVLLSLGASVLHRKEPAHVVAIDLTPAAPPAANREPQKRPAAKPVEDVHRTIPVSEPVVPPVPVARLTLASATVAAPPAVRVDAPPPPPAPAAQAASASTSSAAGAVGMASANLNGIRMIAGEPPRYPLESRRLKEQGTVRLRVLLGTDGRVKTIEVATSSGFERLDKAALGAVRHWRWAPIVRDGQPVEVPGFLDIPFVLRGL